MKKSIERLHYENADLWSRVRWADASLVAERAGRVLELIPESARSVLDVGSGNGLLARLSRGKHPIVSLDRSIAALQQAEGKRCQGTAFALPFGTDSFDVVVSMEMLEHLPAPSYQPALEEITRVSRKYIIITVPFMESLTRSFVTCPQCYCYFHPYYHVRQYDADILHNLFALCGWSCTLLEPVGISRTKRMQPVWQLIRLYFHRRGANFPRDATCPQCGYKRPETNSEQPPGWYSTPIRKRLDSAWPTCPAYLWWLAMYKS